MHDFGPLGDSMTAAAIVSAVFGILAIMATYNWLTSKFYLYTLGGMAAGYGRAIAFAIRAASIAKGGSTRGEAFVHFYFTGMGFVAALEAHLHLVFGWLENTSGEYKPKVWLPLMKVFKALVPLLFSLGPIMGCAEGLLRFQFPSDDHTVKADYLARTGLTAFFLFACICVLTTTWLTVYTMKRTGSWSIDMHKHPHTMIAYVVPSALLMCWTTSYRLAFIWKHPQLFVDESLMYPLQVLPEIIEMAMWAVPTLFARSFLSSQFRSWWTDKHRGSSDIPGSGRKPLFGFGCDVHSEVDKVDQDRQSSNDSGGVLADVVLVEMFKGKRLEGASPKTAEQGTSLVLVCR